jgi:hypothetical protein
MYIQFRTLIFQSRPKEQQQERLRLKKSVTLLSVVIRALGSPLGPHLKSDLSTNLYSGSTPIAIKDESNLQISFNIVNKSSTSLSAAIGALGSPLRPHPESDLPTYLYSDSTLIVIMDESDRQISFNILNKSTTSLSAVIRALGFHLGPHPENDLVTCLYSGVTTHP